MTRIYTHVKQLEETILQLKAQGKTNREIGQKYGLTKKQVINLITRYNRRTEKLQAGIPLKRRGRPPKTPPSTQKELKHEIKRLEMENALLRSFLQAVGRR